MAGFSGGMGGGASVGGGPGLAALEQLPREHRSPSCDAAHPKALWVVLASASGNVSSKVTASNSAGVRVDSSLRVLVVQQDADEPHHLHKLSFTLLVLLLEILHLLFQAVSLSGIIGGHVVRSDSLR